MELSVALKNLSELQLKLYAHNAAETAMYIDGATVAPKGTAEGRGVALGVLAKEMHSFFASPETGELLSELELHSEELTSKQKRQVELLRRDYDKLFSIPAEEYAAYTKLVNDAEAVWYEAKEKSDFSLFRPYLEKLIDYRRRFALMTKPGVDPYETLLNEFERGVSVSYLDRFFDQIKSVLVPLIGSIGEKETPKSDFLYRNCPIELQRKFTDRLMELEGLDRRYCTVGETEHPFTSSLNSRDSRITTHYTESNFADSMYSVLHEGGHALYDLGSDPSFDYTVLFGGVSMGIHESQSRFYENIIGRSLPFIRVLLPEAKKFFPSQLEGVTAEEFYRAVNIVTPSLIRTEADEVTYPLHCLIRYEIEKQLISGSLSVADLPEAWNALYSDYLGVTVPDDRRGCLQDSHWAGGAFGYFPSYALGSAYGAQMLSCMEKEIDVWGDIGRGDLSSVTNWLKDKIHRFGCLKEPSTLFLDACGPFDPSFYTEYLSEKYKEIYSL